MSMIKKYNIEDIEVAIIDMLHSWDTESVLDYAYECLYDDYMDRSKPISNIDLLMEKWGPKEHRTVDNEGYFGA